MAQPHAQPGEIVSTRPMGSDLANQTTVALFKTKHVEVIRLVIPAGKQLPTHSAPDEIILQCIEGKIAFNAMGKTQELAAGDLLYLAAGEPHSLHGVEDASLLLTILLPKQDDPESKEEQDSVVDEASEESFPASDSPSWTPMTRP